MTSGDRNVQDDLLIHGYCRDFLSLLNPFNDTIPHEVIALCLQFYKSAAIINIAIGACGNKLSSKFFKSLFKEHNLDKQGIDTSKEKANSQGPFIVNKFVYLRQDFNQLIPRCISIDLDANNKDQPNCINVRGENGEGGGYNWARGMYTFGAKLMDDVMDNVRKEIEKFDEPQAFQLMHSIGGATGFFIFHICILNIYCIHC